MQRHCILGMNTYACIFLYTCVYVYENIFNDDHNKRSLDLQNQTEVRRYSKFSQSSKSKIHRTESSIIKIK